MQIRIFVQGATIQLSRELALPIGVIQGMILSNGFCLKPSHKMNVIRKIKKIILIPCDFANIQVHIDELAIYLILKTAPFLSTYHSNMQVY